MICKNANFMCLDNKMRQSYISSHLPFLGLKAYNKFASALFPSVTDTSFIHKCVLKLCSITLILIKYISSLS